MHKNNLIRITYTINTKTELKTLVSLIHKFINVNGRRNQNILKEKSYCLQ